MQEEEDTKAINDTYLTKENNKKVIQNLPPSYNKQLSKIIDIQKSINEIKKRNSQLDGDIRSIKDFNVIILFIIIILITIIIFAAMFVFFMQGSELDRMNMNMVYYILYIIFTLIIIGNDNTSSI
jgi:hypothetical protein